MDCALDDFSAVSYLMFLCYRDPHWIVLFSTSVLSNISRFLLFKFTFNNNNDDNDDDDDDDKIIIIINRTKRQFEIFFFFFFFFLQYPHCAVELFPTCTLKWPGRNRMQITCSTSGAHYVQQVCHMVRRDSSANKFDRVEIAFTLALFYWLKPLTNEGGEETGVPGENLLATNFRKCYILKPEDSNPNRDSNPHSSIGSRLGKQTC